MERGRIGWKSITELKDNYGFRKASRNRVNWHDINWEKAMSISETISFFTL